MGKQFAKKRRRNARSIATAEIIEFQGSKFEAERLPPPIKALNPTQGDYLDALATSPQVVVLGQKMEKLLFPGRPRAQNFAPIARTTSRWTNKTCKTLKSYP